MKSHPDVHSTLRCLGSHGRHYLFRSMWRKREGKKRKCLLSTHREIKRKALAKFQNWKSGPTEVGGSFATRFQWRQNFTQCEQYSGNIPPPPSSRHTVGALLVWNTWWKYRKEMSPLNKKTIAEWLINKQKGCNNNSARSTEEAGGKQEASPLHGTFPGVRRGAAYGVPHQACPGGSPHWFHNEGEKLVAQIQPWSVLPSLMLYKEART